jgi:hypothetical protein
MVVCIAFAVLVLLVAATFLALRAALLRSDIRHAAAARRELEWSVPGTASLQSSDHEVAPSTFPGPRRRIPAGGARAGIRRTGQYVGPLNPARGG